MKSSYLPFYTNKQTVPKTHRAFGGITSLLGDIYYDIGDFDCALNNYEYALNVPGYDIPIVRIHRSDGMVDSFGIQTIIDARKVGFTQVHGYFVPRFQSGNPAKQVSSTITSLANKNAKIDMIWFDVESPEQWSTNPQSNINFIQSLINEAIAQNMKYGIYTQKTKWSPITDNTNVLGSVPLWYAHFDDLASFSDFRPFGAWTKPLMKQYQGDVVDCNVEIDRNFF
ncbi:unnamed protein product [Didymodactylos carnosus]|uniref:Uncharacterized protein n=1 Tax=Didymodactylos carnosus TaxID=1234261 RepID=A0A8S2E8B4_9BILA|nr:unnamed protein product [Didymodactylos carnosus]CAF3856986.1 unnamed protein product [Didymodactylos carnosus]